MVFAYNAVLSHTICEMKTDEGDEEDAESDDEI